MVGSQDTLLSVEKYLLKHGNEVSQAARRRIDGRKVVARDEADVIDGTKDECTIGVNFFKEGEGLGQTIGRLVCLLESPTRGIADRINETSDALRLGVNLLVQGDGLGKTASRHIGSCEIGTR